MKLVQRVRPASPEMGKGDLHIFCQNVGRLSLFRKNVFPFSYAARLVTTSRRRGLRQIFGEIWDNFLISQKTGRRGEESNHIILKITPYPTNYS